MNQMATSTIQNLKFVRLTLFKHLWIQKDSEFKTDYKISAVFFHSYIY